MSGIRIGVVGNSKVSIGRYTYGIENLSIHQWNEGATLQIGAFCSIARNISIFLGGNHRIDWITTYPFGHIFQEELGGQGIVGHPTSNGDIIIGNDVWIGSGVTIMSGVTIGDGAVLAANSHIVKDVKPYEIVGGNPAKSLKFRFEQEIIDKLLQLRWWELELETIKEITHDLSTPPTSKLLDKLLATYR
ncbi:hypothetical protein A1D22_02090 [Pasteurellaceae bacterium LFhippo2]|nr:hypothetical protein [Pasteurellaceae bacterium LFhippo2]